jgi:hypothetical protein
MAPQTPQTFGASRRSRDAPLFRARAGAPIRRGALTIARGVGYWMLTVLPKELCKNWRLLC